MNTSRQCQQTTYFQHSRQLHRNVNAVHSTAAQACLRRPSNFSFAWRPKELTGDEQHPAKIKITAWHQQSGHAHAITRSGNWLDCCKIYTVPKNYKDRRWPVSCPCKNNCLTSESDHDMRAPSPNLETGLSAAKYTLLGYKLRNCNFHSLGGRVCWE